MLQFKICVTILGFQKCKRKMFTVLSYATSICVRNETAGLKLSSLPRRQKRKRQNHFRELRETGVYI